MFTKSNLPKLDTTQGQALKTVPMLASILLADRQVQAPYGLLSGVAGRDAYMIQSLDNGKGQVDQYVNKTSQLFVDYAVALEGSARQLADQRLHELYFDLEKRLAHLAQELGNDAYVYVVTRVKANQTVLGRALEAGVMTTHEGDITFAVGDYFQQDSKGRIWPIATAVFERDYKLLSAWLTELV